jgi:peptidoglycan/xylan/chitin deacetylase (PgdA/CDA1 family)
MDKSFYNLSAAFGLDALFAHVYRRSPIVLAFHGVTDEAPGGIHNYEGSHLYRPVFETLLQELAGRYRFVTLGAIESWLSGGDPPPERAVAVTFDDGYRNVLTQAAPVLRDVGAPATVFVTTDFVVKGRMLWPDRLLAALAASPHRSLVAPVNGRTAELPLVTDADVVEASDHLRVVCKSLPDDERQNLVDNIVARLDVDEAALLLACDDFRPLDPVDLGEFEAYGITVGSHTSSHPVLARCSPARMSDELQESRNVIENLTGLPCTQFAYPNGAVGDFNAGTREAVREAGYTCAVTTVKKRVNRQTDPLEIPRYLLTHNRISKTEFAVEVSGFPTFLRRIKGKLTSR